MLDYPDNTACVVWFSGCNMRCPYCHNPELIKGKGKFSSEDVMAFLEKRKGKLDGVVLSGGEVTLYKDIIGFIKDVKKLGFLVKIDTNGTRPNTVRQLLDEELLNYVALDYKSPDHRFKTVTSINEFASFKETLSMLIDQDKVQFEVRTTVHTDILNEDDINDIINDLDTSGYKGTHYVQNYTNHDGAPVLGNLEPQKRLLNRDDLKTPNNFKLEFRNFPEKPERGE